MPQRITWVSLLFVITVLTFVVPSPLRATTFTGSIFGWQIHLPDDWKIEVLKEGGGSISGAPSRAWAIGKDPMNQVVYQVEDADMRNSVNYENFKKKNFEAISASMLITAQKAGAQTISKTGQIMVGDQIFDSIVWILEAPDRPDFKSMTLVGPMADKAVTIGISCTGVNCDTAFNAIDSSQFSNPDGKGPVIPAPPPLPPSTVSHAPVWDFTIPLGWKRVAGSSPEDKLAIEKGEGNSLSYALFEDEGQEFASTTIHELKGEFFKDTITEFQQIAHENGLLFNTEEEVVTLGRDPFQTISLGLLDPNSQEPVMVVAQMIALLNDRLAMIIITCVDESSCNEVQQAVENSSFR